MKRIFIVVIAVWSMGFAKTGFAQGGNDTLKVLFVGNSYTFWHKLDQVVSFISDQAEKKLVTNGLPLGGLNYESTGGEKEA